jgi:hypothetical protein
MEEVKSGGQLPVAMKLAIGLGPCLLLAGSNPLVCATGESNSSLE